MDWGSKAAVWDFSDLGQSDGGDHYEYKDGLADAARTSAGGRGVVKRPKASPGGGAGLSHKSAAACTVDGCGSDLSGCREYHRRHKVCEAHAKTPVVMVAGKQQRFCQQCSRFHLLAEFDEGKRSCRKRLDCHNRRRRKPLPQPPLLLAGGLLSSHHQGQRFVPYPDPSLAARVRPDWRGAVQGNEGGSSLNFGSLNPTNDKRGPVPYHHLQHERKQQFPFSHSNGSVVIASEVAAAETSFNPVSSSSQGSELFPHRMHFLDPDRAPSLLSSPWSSTSSPSIKTYPLPVGHVGPVAGAANIVPPTFQTPPQSIHRVDSLVKCTGGLQDTRTVSLTGLSCLDAESNEATTILVPDTGSSDFSSMPIFDAIGAADGSSDGASQDMPPFYWH